MLLSVQLRNNAFSPEKSQVLSVHSFSWRSLSCTGHFSSNENPCPPTDASSIAPPLTIVKTATPAA